MLFRTGKLDFAFAVTARKGFPFSYGREPLKRVQNLPPAAHAGREAEELPGVKPTGSCFLKGEMSLLGASPSAGARFH